MPVLDIAPPPLPAQDARLGRHVHFDVRSANYPIRALLTATQLAKPRSYTWNCLSKAPWLNRFCGAVVGDVGQNAIQPLSKTIGHRRTNHTF
jgi:hypothetical protein